MGMIPPMAFRHHHFHCCRQSHCNFLDVTMFLSLNFVSSPWIDIVVVVVVGGGGGGDDEEEEEEEDEHYDDDDGRYHRS